MGGSKSSGGARTPYEAPNSLSSAQTLRVMDAISEGVIAGFGNGDDAPLKSVYLNDTPIQNSDGSYNFKGVTAYFQRGTPDQAYIPGFESTERTTAVSTRVQRATPVVRTITDEQVSSLRVTVGVERNTRSKNNGDVVAATTSVRVELLDNGGVKRSKVVSFTEKSSGVYYQDVLFDKVPATPFSVRVTRITDDSATDRVNNNTYFASFVEVIDAKMCYPNTAIAALMIDSDQFGSQMPRRNYLLKGMMVQVPDNYDPVARTYTGIWSGGFKLAWSNNPAWVFYDLLTNNRYSTLARRMDPSDIDKWALYQVARYCDEMVPDGFGGEEPRFVCNAYVTDKREAGELLTDLASAFAGLPIWNGNQITTVIDRPTDPVALYTNSNVVDGVFNYSSAALKSIHTAVHIRYADASDGYRSKVEYVSANPEIVNRFGHNVKSVTAFGCTSRGQAARLGHWILQTELRQQNTVSFTVGREGLKHLPYDVIQVADNDYAGTEIGGRIVSVEGDVVTLDRDVTNTVNAHLRYFDVQTVTTPSGTTTQPVQCSTPIVAQPAPNKVRLATAPTIGELDVWGLSGQVRPRQYRAMGIKENTDDGTYTITALLHDPDKYGVVDNSAAFDDTLTTLHGADLKLVNADVVMEGGQTVLTWDGAIAAGDAVSYDIKVFRDNKLLTHIPDALTPELRLDGLKPGNYRAEIRARNSRGVLSEPLIKSWVISYEITGVLLTPQLFALNLRWVLPTPLSTRVSTEIWYGRTNNIEQASLLTSLPMPQAEYTLTNVKLSDTFYFWLRLADDRGFTGEFTSVVSGGCDTNPNPILEQLQGSITKSALSQALIAQLQADIDAGVASEAAARAAALLTEANARATALQAETNARIADVNSARQQASSALLQKANELGTRITNTERVNATQAQQISAVTAAQGQTAAGLETERQARIAGDAAEARARQTLAGRVSTAEGNITTNNTLRIQGDKANADAIAAMGTRVGAAESSISSLRNTTTQNNTAATTAIDNLRAELHSIGGTNLLVDSEFKGYRKWGSPTVVVSTQQGRRVLKVTPGTTNSGQFGVTTSVANARTAVVSGNTYTLSLNVQGTAGVVASKLNYVYLLRDNSEGPNFRLNDIDITSSLSNRVKVTFTAPWSSNTVRLLIGVRGTFSTSDWFAFHSVKLERGNIATDWSPTPEDLVADTAAVKADLETYKQAQVGVDAAQTNSINGALSRLGTAESGISTLNSTKASKTEVASLARTTLQSEWRGYADTAKTQAIDAAKALNNTTNARVTSLESTVANNQASTATQINTLSAAVNNSTTGTNLIQNSDFASGFDGWSMHNWNQISGLSCGFNLTAGPNSYVLKDEKVFWARDDRPLTNGVKRLWATSGRNRFAVRPGDVVQCSALVSGIGLQDDPGRIVVYIDFYTADNVPVTSSQRNLRHYDLPLTTNLMSGGTPNQAYTSLSRFHVLWQNVVVPPNAVWGQIVIRFTSTSETGSYAFFTRPQVCVVPSIDTAYVPYRVGGSGLSAQIVQNSTVTAELNGKVQALHTVKVQAVGARKAVAGIALGADGATGDSQFLVMADKFALVNPNSNAIDVPFVVNNNAGGAKMALKGDFIATGTILGSHIKANETLTAPNILGGSLNIGGGKFMVSAAGAVTATDLTVTGGQINVNNRFIVDRQGNMTAKNGTFEGVVYADKIVGGVVNFYIGRTGRTLTETIGAGSRSLFFTALQAIFPRTKAAERDRGYRPKYYMTIMEVRVGGETVAAVIWCGLAKQAGWSDTLEGHTVNDYKPFGDEVNYIYRGYAGQGTHDAVWSGRTAEESFHIKLGTVRGDRTLSFHVSGGLYRRYGENNYVLQDTKTPTVTYPWAVSFIS